MNPLNPYLRLRENSLMREIMALNHSIIHSFPPKPATIRVIKSTTPREIMRHPVEYIIGRLSSFELFATKMSLDPYWRLMYGE